jgi:lauroyl/myristoyl acyltransferase
MTPQERITLTAFRAAWFLCARLPERVVKRAFIFFADVTTLRNTAGVKRLQFNLARVLNVAQCVRICSITQIFSA